MSLKLMTLNMHGDYHMEEVCGAITQHAPDVLCLQEVFAPDRARLAALGPYHVQYAVMAQMAMPKTAPERPWGVAILTRMPLLRHECHYYSEDAVIRSFRESTDARCAMLWAELVHGGRHYRIATTHFT